MSQLDAQTTLNTIAQVIYDKKGTNILALDVRGVSSLTDFVMIAEGNVDKHVTAIANAIIVHLKSLGIRTNYTEGVQAGDWIVLDYLNIMVHLFMPGVRDKYRLEELWRDGQIVDLQISTQVQDTFR